MSENMSAARRRLEGLSKDKVRLVESLLQKKAMEVHAIARYPREQTAEGALAPASGSQRRLWFIHQLEGGSAAYHVPLVVRLQGTLNRAALQAALDMLIERHEPLRTTFTQSNGEPLQLIRPAAPFALQLIDLRNRSAEERQTDLLTHSQEELSTPFDLAVGPLMRGRLLHLQDHEYVLMLTLHHIISDGWSVGILARELAAFYEANCKAEANPLPPLAVQYADYAQWQRQLLSGSALEGQLSYWQTHLRGAPDLLELPTDRPRPAVQSHRGDSLRMAWDRELALQLKALSKQHGVTLAMTLYAAWSVLLSRLSGQDDIVVGMPVANRRRAVLEGLVGFFANTLAVRVQLHDDPRVDALLLRMKDITLGAYAHQDTPFEQVVEMLQPARSLSHNPVFQVMLAIQNNPRGTLELPGLTLEQLEVQLRTSQFDLILSLSEHENGIDGLLTYASDLFDRDTVDRWMRCFTSLLRGMVNNPRSQVSRLPLMDAEEWHRVVHSFNETDVAYPRDTLFHELFEEQVRKAPTASALVYQTHRLSYAELNRRANQLAAYLRGHGVAPNRIVAICMERSHEMVVAMLAVLKAGGAFVPLDPAYPSDRLEYMLQDAAPTVVLTHERVRSTLTAGGHVVSLDRDWQQISAHSDQDVPAATIRLQPTDLAYVIYTSGSTGRPKGVMCEHRGLCNLATALLQSADLRSDGAVLQFASPSFDACIWELAMAFARGTTLHLVDREDLMPGEPLYHTLESRQIAHVTLTPSALSALPMKQGLSSLRTLIVAGEACPGTLVQQWSHGRRFINAYGPTEATVCASMHLCEASEHRAPPIGGPAPNTRIYILDQHRAPVPVGIAGEIYIGGAGVARGYLNKQALTDERFLPDPFSRAEHARMYRSGDRGRWRPDGTIEYLGRGDGQLKLRGFRIELGEIEAHLAQHPRIKDAVIIAREDVPGEKRLVAYVTAHEAADAAAAPTAPTAEALRTYLKDRLPEYMVPSAFVVLDGLPMTPNGKLDRRALPAPEAGAYARRQYEAPEGHIEEILAGIWQSLLRVECVGRQDNFFELGGHSLLIVQLMERLRKVGLSTEVRRVFDSPTLADLAASLDRTAIELDVPPAQIPKDCEAITPSMLPLVDLEPGHIASIVEAIPGGAANIQDIYPLTPLQEGILFHHMMSGGAADVYVVPTLLSVGSRTQVEQFIEALQHCIDRHDVLRTALLWDGLPRAVQVVCRRAVLPVEELTLRDDRDALEQMKEWLRPEYQHLDLRQAPLLRLKIGADRSGHWYAILQGHHIVDDATSRRILLSEIAACLQGRAHQLSPPVPYRNHVARALAYAKVADPEVFFREKLAGVSEPTAPFGLLDVYGDGTSIHESREELPLELASRVRAQARRAGVSAASVFHAAWALVVACTTARDDIVFGSVLLGRMHGSPGAQNVLGMFINTLPLRLDLCELTARQLVERTQREIVALLGHEQASLAVAQRCSDIVGSAPLFTSLLNYRQAIARPTSGWFGVDGPQLLAGQARTNYPILLSVDDLGEGFVLTAQTDQRIDASRLTRYLGTALESLVGALESAVDAPALMLNVLPESECREIIETFSDTHAEYPQDQLIHHLFEAQAARAPESVAVLHGEQTLTYGELNQQANQLARYLRELGVAPGQPVGVCINRCAHMVVSLLAILKAGAAYVPLDPAYPVERLQHMLEDAAPRVVLTQRTLRKAVSTASASVLVLEDHLDAIMRQDCDNLPDEGSHDQAARLVYVIYTSGSTGRPKGTAMSHRSMVNLLEWHRQHLALQPGERVLQFAALSFDVAFQETFSTLCGGGTLVLIDEWVRRDAHQLMDALRTQSIERLFLPPLMLQSLSEEYRTSGHSPEALRNVITAGEQLRITGEISGFFQALPQCRLHNHYGPTETHVVSALTLEGSPQLWPALPTIGRPIANTAIYVLNERLQPVPIGVPGEIFIGGAGVAQGYLNRPELTAQRFVRDPFAGASARMYKTGDVGRWRRDGTLEYLGRNDDQVKIRGYRIELGEIEAQLKRHEAVKEAAVVAREDVPGAKVLVAYLTCREHCELRAEQLRAALLKGLPEHMVPSAFVILEHLPLTPSGKLNRRALPAPEMSAYASRQYEPPRDEIEEMLATIWRELLRVERVGRTDDFFELGGHSLLATRVLSRVRELMVIDVPLKALFDHPKLEQLAIRVRKEKQAAADRERQSAADLTHKLEQQIGELDEAMLLARIAELEQELGSLGQSATWQEQP